MPCCYASSFSFFRKYYPTPIDSNKSHPAEIDSKSISPNSSRFSELSISDWFTVRYVFEKDENIFIKTQKLKFDPDATR